MLISTGFLKTPRDSARASTDSSFFLNVGSVNSDPWISFDVAAALKKKSVLQKPYHVGQVG